MRRDYLLGRLLQVFTEAEEYNRDPRGFPF